MDTHSPHPTPSPDPSENSDRSGTHPIPFDALIDTVAGDPPVPITVWRTARTTTDSARVIGARLAYRLISAYSRPGEAVVDIAAKHDLKVGSVYSHAIHGAVIQGDKAAIGKLLNDPRVDFVEEDGYVKLSATQTGATWGLDRVDQRDRLGGGRPRQLDRTGDDEVGHPRPAQHGHVRRGGER